MRRSIAHIPSRILAAALFLLFATLPGARAQARGNNATPRELSAAFLPAAASSETPPATANFRPSVTGSPRKMSRAQRRAWFLLGAAQHGAAFFDARTTREAMRHYQELDPLLRPFAHSAVIYPAMQLAPLGLDWLATRLATSRHKWLRRLWWVPQAAATAGFIWSGVHNLSLPASPAASSTPGVTSP